MKEIIIKCPEEFTNEQVDFIKKSAMLQVESEIKKELKVPQADIDACEVKVQAVKEAMGIVDKLIVIEEVIEPLTEE